MQKRASTDSTSIQQQKSISKFPRAHRAKLDYDKYLVGRSFLLFIKPFSSEPTRVFYRKKMYYFCEFMGMTTEELATRYGAFIRKRGGLVPNIEGQVELEKRIEDYVLKLLDRVEKKEITSNTCRSMIPPITRFCEANSLVTVGWSRINRLLPQADGNAKDEAYTLEQIQKILQHCDLRAKVIVLFLCSSGMRVEGLRELKHGEITPMYDPKDNTKLIAAHVVVYNGTDSKYDAFVTPEAYEAYQEYLTARKAYGEKITASSYAIINRFNTKPPKIKGSSSEANDPKQISPSTISMILRTATHKAGVREPSPYYNSRFNIKQAHGFRKFYSTMLSTVKTADGRRAVDLLYKVWLMSHSTKRIYAEEENYNRADRVQLLLDEYLKVVPELTISDEQRANVRVKRLEADISNMKTVQAQLDEKENAIKEMERKFEELQKSLEEDKKKKAISFAKLLSLVRSGNIDDKGYDKILEELADADIDYETFESACLPNEDDRKRFREQMKKLEL